MGCRSPAKPADHCAKFAGITPVWSGNKKLYQESASPFISPDLEALSILLNPGFLLNTVDKFLRRVPFLELLFIL